jgi:hypothetical protein
MSGEMRPKNTIQTSSLADEDKDKCSLIEEVYDWVFLRNAKKTFGERKFA